VEYVVDQFMPFLSNAKQNSRQILQAKLIDF